MGRGAASPREHWLSQSQQQGESAQVRIERFMPVLASTSQAQQGRTASGGQLSPRSYAAGGLSARGYGGSVAWPSGSGQGSTVTVPYSSAQPLHAVVTPRRGHGAPPHSQQHEYGRPYQHGYTPHDPQAWHARQQPQYNQGGRTQSAATPRGTSFPDYHHNHLAHGYSIPHHAQDRQMTACAAAKAFSDAQRVGVV